jgi:NAD(P)-dependent dehydrogenase (short-subunit alcohol dehydrogenase family)
MVIPVIIEWTFKDGTKEVDRLPAGIWRLNEKQFSKVFVKEKEVASIRLDPMKETADIDESNAIKVAESLGGRGYALDVSVAGDVEAVAQRIEEELGPVTMLVNAAGILQGAAVPPEEVPMQTFDRIYEVNLRGAYAVCVAFGLRMGTRGNGAIVNFGSLAAIRSTPLHAYGPLKAAILRLTENLSAEWGILCLQLLLDADIRTNLQLVVRIATKSVEKLGVRRLVQLFDDANSSDGMVLFT